MSEFNIIPREDAGAIPPSAKPPGQGTLNQIYPWPDMEEGDMVEIEYSDTGKRASIVNSLRYYLVKNPTKRFVYKLTNREHDNARIVAVWRDYNK